MLYKIPAVGFEPTDPASLVQCIFQFCYTGMNAAEYRTMLRL